MTQQEENANGENLRDFENILEDDIREAEAAEDKIEDEMKGIDKIQDEIAMLKDALARAQADYHNLVKRFERDREDMGAFLTGSIVAKFLPFVDNLERIISATPEEMQAGALFEGVKSTYTGILKTLESLGVKPFESIGQEVDANLHDVMSQLPGDEGKILQEFEKGYMIGDKVLRHAKVIVGSGN